MLMLPVQEPNSKMQLWTAEKLNNKTMAQVNKIITRIIIMKATPMAVKVTEVPELVVAKEAHPLHEIYIIF